MKVEKTLDECVHLLLRSVGLYSKLFLKKSKIGEN